MKYIMFEVTQRESNVKRKIPFVFPNELQHKDVRDALLPLMYREYATVETTSAGDYSTKRGACSGESYSLNMSATLTDSQVIAMHDYFNGREWTV